MDPISSRRISDLVDQVHEQKARLEKLERSTDLTHSAVDSGGIVVKDAEGNPRVIIGQTESGVVTTQYANGPIPNEPSLPTVEAEVGSVNVTWDGLDAGGNPAPEDFKALNIYASVEPDFEPGPGTYVGVLSVREGGTKTVALPYGTWHLRTALYTLSGQTGPFSPAVSARVLSVVELPDVAEEFAQGRADLAALDGKLTEASTEIAAATERIQAAEDILSPLPGDLEAVRAEADAAVTAAEQARNEALAAQTAATEANARALTVLPNGSFEDDLKYWQALPGKTLPTVTTDAYVESKAALFGDNTGIKSTTNIPVTPAQVWELSAYYKSTTASSGGIVLEFSNSQDALAPKSTVQPTPDVSGKWVRAVLRVTIPDGMNNLTAKIDYVKGGVTIDGITLRDVTDVVRLEKSAQEAATKAQSALDKSSALEAKVATLEVGHQAVTKRLTEAESNLSANREKATADLTALNTALREAFATADSDVLASAGTLASQAKSDAVAVAKEDAQTKVNEALDAASATALQIAKAEAQREAEEAQNAAQNYANNLPKVLHGTTAPSTGAPDGSVYFMHQTSITGRVVGQWVRSAGTWTSTPITDAAIANLDVGKLTAGTAAIDVAVLNKVWADLGVFNRLTAGEAWIGGAQIKDGEITASKITVTDSLVANILGAQAVVADKLVANGNLWAKAAQIITLDASRLTVTDSATISEAVIEKFWAQTAVIKRLTAGEAWIGETVIKDGAITAPKIRADAVEASHIKAKAIKADHMDFVSVDPSTGGAMSLDSSGIRLEREGSTIFQLTNASVDTISLIGADGVNVAGMSNDGSVTGLTGTFDELNVGGMNLNAIMEEQPRGIVARTVRDSSTGARPSTSSDHIQPVMRMEFPVRGGYTYEIRAEGLGVYMEKYTGTTAIFYMYSAGDNNIAAIGDSATKVRATAITPIRSEHSGDTAPVSMVWHFTPSEDYVASILIGYSIWRGSEPVRINCASTRPFYLTAREFEKVVTTGKSNFLGTVSAGNTSTENVAAPRRETQTWTASAAASWAGGSRYSTDYAGSTNDLWQGYWSGSPNARMSHINFNGLGDKGKSIASTRGKITTLEKLEVYLYNSFFYYYSGGKVRLHYHNSTTTSAYPSSTSYIGDVKMGRGEGKWIEITNSNAKAAFLSGGFTGIALDPRGSKDQNYYGAFKGMDGGKYAPKIRATYLTT